MATADALAMPAPQELIVFLLRILSPAIVFVGTLSLSLISPTASSSSPSHIISVVVANHTPRRGAILLFLTLSALTYLFDGLTFVVFAVLQKQWTRDTGIEYNSVIGLVAFSGLAIVGAFKDVQGQSIWLSTRIKLSVVFSLIVDVLLTIFIGLSISASGQKPTSIPLPVLLHIAFPILRILFLLPLIGSLLSPRVSYSPVASDSLHDATDESALLLPSDNVVHTSSGLLAVPGLGESTKYGTFRQGGRTMEPSSNPTTRPSSLCPTETKPEISLDPSWSEIGRRLKRLSPYLWPSKSKSLQILAAFCILLLLVGRVVNAFVPFTLGELIRILEGKSERSPWPVLFLYVAFRFLQGSGGIAALRDSLWTPVMQYSDREMSQLSFDHLLNLSFAFHTRRKTGEILRILDRGAAINRTLELIMFSIVPTFIDIIIALVVFCIKFDWTLAAVIFVVMFTYIGASVILTQWRTKIRRRMNERDIITRGIHTDCLLNYETVKYFCGEEHEGERYRSAIREYQALEYKVMISLNLLNLVQNFIISVGLLVGSLIVAHSVTTGKADASDFVIFITYLAQLYNPLNQLGFIYRSVNQSLVDTEKLLKLLNEPTDVNDKPGAPDLVVPNGEIEFDNVSFTYDGRTTALNGVSFKVPKGSSVALVGESGSGKSTILRLFYRFYDLQEGQGRILIDGQDIRDVTQKSLRQAIGVVPQDSVLFNTTIGYNIGYGKFDATSEEIETAAQSAQMHDRIMSFPEGYETTVGERGVRLSGGEKQRVAIARTLLKNPPILLLDEATSALDTSTEKDIQKALQNLMIGRSSLSIAHRLSTISSADVILVLKDGQIVEQGSHRDLLAQDGIFASMWADQVSSTEEPIILEDTKTVEAAPYSIEMTDSEPVGESSAKVQVPAAESIVESQEPNVDDEAPKVPPKEDSSAPISFPTSDGQSDVVAHAVKAAEAASPVAFPESTPAPVSFPSGDDTSEPQTPKLPPMQSPGVTFDTGANVPSRSGTPDPEAEPKRKRISSQNFQRLARRISITTRRQGSVSSIIPGLKRDKSERESPRVSTDEGQGSVRGEGSPTPSITADSDKKLRKKDKKKRKSFVE